MALVLKTATLVAKTSVEVLHFLEATTSIEVSPIRTRRLDALLLS